ncbi:sensor histidine kinase [Paenibacillus puerhi]|uniref:sensor histidine kinase n=1 Tax=Paenibacillus puerhi TaxID=2692622 RepID=UPI001F36F542|nr:ATP-binding protein [Paenibacillus puerhi]
MAIVLFTLVVALPAKRMAEPLAPALPAGLGELDLQGYDWEQQPGVRLNGEWKLYRHRLLTPEELRGLSAPEGQSEFVKLPARWDSPGRMTGALPGSGAATYHLSVKLDASSRTFALQIPYIRTAYKIWVNGELRAEAASKAGSGQSSPSPDRAPHLLLFTPSDGHLDIVLQLSGFHRWSGGLLNTPYLGWAEKVDAEVKGSLSVDMIAVGGMLVLGVHYIAQFLLRRKETESLYFGMFCLLLAIRSSFVGDGILYDWDLGLSGQASRRIENICLFLSAPAIGLFVRLLYPQEVPGLLARSIVGLGVGSSILTVLLPPPWIPYVVVLFVGAASLLGACLLGALGLALWRKREGAMFVMVGAVACLGAMLGDEWIGNELAYPGQLSGPGLLLGTLFASFILSVRSARAVASVETLSRQMRELNAGLEQKIRDRTAELERINHSLELVNEDLARMETSRRHLLSNISHDLGTPMTLIQGYVEALMDGVVKPEQQQKYLKLIHNRILGLSRLIKDLFQLSKLEARQMEFDIQTVRTEELVSYFDERYELELAGAGLRFETTSYTLQPGDALPSLVRIDINRIDQVLTNIIYNAVKHTPAGGQIQLQFSVDEHSLVVQVQDNGAGIAPEDLPYIFDRFYKKDKSRNTSGGGSGLGLAIAKEIVDFHGGRIWAHSRLGQGACIAFMLPLIK